MLETRTVRSSIRRTSNSMKSSSTTMYLETTSQISFFISSNFSGASSSRSWIKTSLSRCLAVSLESISVAWSNSLPLILKSQRSSSRMRVGPPAHTDQPFESGE